MDSYQFVEHCIEKTGGANSRFQKWISGSLILFISFGCPGFFIYAFGFFALAPWLTCTDTVTGLQYACKEPDACEANITFVVDYANPDTIKNWITDLNLTCIDNYDLKVSMFGVALMIGYFMGSLTITPLGDSYGRKYVHLGLAFFQTTWILVSVCFQTLYPNYYLVVTSLFLTGLCSASRFNIGMLYGLEFTTKDYQKGYSLVAQIAAGFMSVIIGIQFMYYKNMVPGLLAYCGFQYCMCIIFYCVIPESPFFLFKKGQYMEFYEVLQRIARFNDCTTFNIEELKALQPREGTIKTPANELTKLIENKEGEIIEQENANLRYTTIQEDENATESIYQEVQQTDDPMTQQSTTQDISKSFVSDSEKKKSTDDQQKTSILQNFKRVRANKQVCTNTIALCMIWSTACFTFYFVEFYMKLVPSDNIYVLMILIGGADIVSAICFYAFIRHFAPKPVLIIIFASMTVSSLTLFILLQVTGDYDSDSNVTEGLSYTYSALIFLIRGQATIGFAMAYYCNSTMIPTLMIASVYSITNICCRFAVIFAPLTADIVPNPSIIVSVLSLLALWASIYVKPVRDSE